MSLDTIFPSIELPGTFIEQVVEAEIPAVELAESALAACIFATQTAIQDDSFAGVYEGVADSFAYPEKTASQNIITDDVGIILKNIVLLVLAAGLTTGPALVAGTADDGVGTIYFEDQVDGSVADASTTPPPSTTAGDRYILVTGTGSLDPGWGTIAGVGDNDIVEYDGANWNVAFDTSAATAGAFVFVTGSGHSRWTGSAWGSVTPTGSVVGNIVYNTLNLSFVKDLAPTTGTIATAQAGDRFILTISGPTPQVYSANIIDVVTDEDPGTTDDYLVLDEQLPDLSSLIYTYEVKRPGPILTGSGDNTILDTYWEKSITDTVADATASHPGTGLPASATGQRYILQTNTGSLGAGWGTITGVGDNDIVEYDGADWVVVFDSSAANVGAITWDRDESGGPTPEHKRWSGTAWVSITDNGSFLGSIVFNNSTLSFFKDLSPTTGAIADASVNDTLIIDIPGVTPVTIEARIVAKETTEDASATGDDYLVLDQLLPSLAGLTYTYTVKRYAGEIKGDGSGNDIILEDTTAQDQFKLVFPDDESVMQHPVLGEIKAKVLEVVSGTRLKLSKEIDPAINVDYEIVRNNDNRDIIADSEATVLVADPTILSDITVDFITSGAEIGNFVRVIDLQTGNIKRLIVEEVISSTRIRVSEALTAGKVVSYLVYKITDPDLEEELDNGVDFVATADTVDISTLTIDGLAIKSANVYVSYTADDLTNAGNIISIPKPDDAESIAGKKDKRNKLGLAASIAFSNTINKIFVVPLTNESSQSWFEGFVASEKERVYNLAPMTQDFSVIDQLRSHISGMSTAKNKRWRKGWVNRDHPYEGVEVPKTTQGKLVYTNAIEQLTISDPLQDFGEIANGSFVIMTENNSTVDSSKMKIFQKIGEINNTKIKLDPKPFTSLGRGVYEQEENNIATSDFTDFGDYEVRVVLTKPEQAQALAGRAAIYNDRRLNYISNEECVIDLPDKDNPNVLIPEVLPGYYLCAANAGLASAVFSHQPITNHPVGGIKGVRKGSEWFSIDDLGVLAGAGCWVVVQQELDVTQPFNLKQVTTAARQGIKVGEDTFTRNLDFITYTLLDAHATLTGENNVVPATIEAATDTTIAALEILADPTTDIRSNRNGNLGPRVLSYSFSGWVEDENFADTLNSDTTVTVPITLNKLKMTLFGN